MPTLIRETVHPAFIFDHLLSSEQCSEYRRFIDKLVKKKSYSRDPYFQDIIKLPQISRDLWPILQQTLPSIVKRHGKTYRLIGLSDRVTISRHCGDHIKIHKDKDMRFHQKDLICLYKLGIYLNDLSDPHDPRDKTGGTSFYDKSERWLWTAKPAEGRGVLFDMREYHSGAKVPHQKTKYMLGFRPVYQLVPKSKKSSSSFSSSFSSSSSSSSGKFCSRCQKYH